MFKIHTAVLIIIKNIFNKLQIELDFNLLYPAKDTKLFAKWDNFVDKIIFIYGRDVKNDASKLTLSKLASCENSGMRYG